MAKIVTDDVLKKLFEKMRDTFIVRNDPSVKELSDKDRKVLDGLPEDAGAKLADLLARVEKLEGAGKNDTTTTEGNS